MEEEINTVQFLMHSFETYRILTSILLLTDKAAEVSDIPTKIIKENSVLLSEFLCLSLCMKTFSPWLKLVDATPLFKKGKN